MAAASTPTNSEQKGNDKRGDTVQKRYFLDACLDGAGEDQAAGFAAARAQVLNFFRAGTDTTAASLCWTLIELSQHPKLKAAAQGDRYSACVGC